MRAPLAAAVSAFLAIVADRGASAAPRSGLPSPWTFRGRAVAAAAVPWGKRGVDAPAPSGGKTGKKKRRKRSSSSSSSSSSSPSARQTAAEGSNLSTGGGAEDESVVPADVSSSVGVPPLDGGVAAAADSDVADGAVPSPASKSAGGTGKMPSLFVSPDEAMYDRYAACLAATEGLRKARDASLSKGKKRRGGSASAVDPDHRGGLFGALRRHGKNGGGEGAAGSDDEEYKRACAQYVLQSSRVIRALGLSVSQFNQLGREVGNDPVLKERVMEQAYLYRMAATLKMQKMPLIEDPSSEQLLKAHRRRRVQMFARSMTEIEDLRSEQTERLKRSLNVDRLPDGLNICDPSIQPLLSPKVRAVCEAFPLQAELIVKKYGLNSDEFNQMLEETRCNPIFRWRVKKYMGKSGEKSLE